ncbi:type I-F CRISPR-associated protein Csy2 [Vibrio plantisponsor]|uniref:type I-F CRISPR-associated protein Csy2 n=1 Tax=Vibrio plantisponsor TaxID=664643 RepID=UPI00370A74DB
MENLLNLICGGDDFWLELLADMGLKPKAQIQLKDLIEHQLPLTHFPDEVNRYSKQLRFPWRGDYLSVTPVVSHAIQQQLSVLSRQRECSLHFKAMSFPHSASIGNLCGSLGGDMNILNYPIEVIANRHQTLGASRSRTKRYFDDFQLTSKSTCSVLAHLTGFEQPQMRKAQKHVRQYQLKIIRKQIALWLLPLIELRDNSVTDPIGFYDEPDDEPDDELAKRFLTINELDFIELTTSLNQRLNIALQNNRFASRFAYHPKLMRVLKTELIWVLTQLSQPEPEPPTVSDSKVQYLYLSSMRVFDAAAMSCPYLSGAPSLTAVWGFVHRYQRELQDLLSDGEGQFEFKDFAFFIRDESVQTSAKLTEPSVIAKARRISQVKRTTIIREDCSDLIFDIVIAIESDQRISDYQSLFQAALPTNFAGGVLFQPEINSGVNWLRTFVSKSELFQAVKGLPGYGTWLSPDSFQPQNLAELRECLTNDCSLIPVANGFHFLESPQERKGALTKLHCYAENNIALAKRVNPIEVRFAGKDHFFEQVFWSLDVEEQTILIKNKRI